MLNRSSRQLRTFSLLIAGLLLAATASGGQTGARVHQDIETKTVRLDIEGMT